MGIMKKPIFIELKYSRIKRKISDFNFYSRHDSYFFNLIHYFCQNFYTTIMINIRTFLLGIITIMAHQALQYVCRQPLYSGYRFSLLLPRPHVHDFGNPVVPDRLFG